MDTAAAGTSYSSRPAISRAASHSLGSAAEEGPKRKRASRLPGGAPAIGCFFLSLIAYTVQTEAAQHVQQALGYRKPFFSLYLGHSGFSLLLPIHLFYLCRTNPHLNLSHFLHLIARNIDWQVRSPTSSLPRPGPDRIRRRLSSLSGRSQTYLDGTEEDDGDAGLDFEAPRRPLSLRSRLRQRVGFDVPRLIGLLGILTLGMTVPALSWYAAVPLTSMAEITTIYNTYAFWALVFSIFFLGEKWHRAKVLAVVLACAGVVCVAMGSGEHRKKVKEPIGGGDVAAQAGMSNSVLGDILALFGAVTMAAYEMAFKILGTLPDEEKQKRLYDPALGGAAGATGRRPTSIDGEWGQREAQGLLQDHDGDNDGEEDRRARASLPKAISQRSMFANGGASSPNRAGSGTASPSYRTMEAVEAPYADASRGGMGRNGFADRAESGTDDGDDDSAAPSIWEDGEEEEVRKGSTRLGRTHSHKGLSKAGGRNGQARIDTLFDADRWNDEDDDAKEPAARTPRQSKRWSSGSTLDANEVLSIPPPLPFGLHANTMTAGIGMLTCSTLWIGLPIAHFLGWERFEIPPDLTTVAYILLVVWTGIFFNGCFMILLSLWGPVLASVSCLLTTILVFFADLLLGHEFRWVSLVGCAIIGLGFAMLVLGETADGDGEDEDDSPAA